MDRHGVPPSQRKRSTVITPTCQYCDSTHLSQYIGIDGELLCQECARREILGLLTDYDKADLAKVRRQIEDRLRKSPALLKETIVSLTIAGEIEI